MFSKRALLALLAAVCSLVFFALLFRVFDVVIGFDPGLTVRWGLPFFTMLFHLLMAVLVGVLVVVCYALSPRFPEYQQALSLARAVSVALVPVLLACVFFSYLYTTGVLPGNPSFIGAFKGYLASNLATAWIITLVAVMVISWALLFFESQVSVAWITCLALCSLVPVAFQSHAAGTGGHHTAVTASALHALAVSVWAGGLWVFIWLFPRLEEERFALLLRRFSTLAAIGFFLTVVSGFISAVLRFADFQQIFTTPYGLTLIAKSLLFLFLGLMAAGNRFLLFKSKKNVKVLLRIISVEIIVMAMVFGISAVLSRIIPPVVDIPFDPNSQVTPAELLTGSLLPPPESFFNYLTQWVVNPVWLVVSIFGSYFYLFGVLRLLRRKDRWPWGRTVSWLLGMLTLLYLTNGGVMVYGVYLFSAHMVMHMTLGMLTPILLALGSPITLLLRSVSVRRDGSRGLREWVLAILHSRYAKCVSSPPVAAAIFILSMWVFYFTDLFRWAMADPLGHQWMVLHFLVSGYLFAQSLLITDPSTHRFSYPARMLVLVLAMASHAFFGVLVMSAEYLLLPDWFGAMGRTWGAPPLLDQQLGGAIAWGITEVPTIFLVVVLCVRWFRDDQKEARRIDRMADRDDDAALRVYNEHLARLSSRR